MQAPTTYFHARTFDRPLAVIEAQVREALSEHGFGVLTEIDVQATFKKKLDEDTPPYKILGACNPHFAHQALQAEALIGTMLPCNVVVRVTEDGRTQVAAVDPVASMQAVHNEALQPVAETVRAQLREVVDGL